MSPSVVGLGCLLLFAASQGLRDALFANVFQSISFLLVAALAFGASGLVFTALSLLRRPGDVGRLCAAPQALLALNATTAAAWLSFFFGLRHLEPAVAAALYNGIGSLMVIAPGGVGFSMVTAQSSLAEKLCHPGVAGALAGLAAVVMADRSGLSHTQLALQAVALGAAAFGGIMITISRMISRWFNDRGIESDAVMGTRFLLTPGLALGLECSLGDAGARPPADRLWLLTAAAFALIVVPSFLVQLGISRTSPLAVNVFRARGPVFVFAVQQLDGRLRFSGATLACIVAFSTFAIGASVLRGWSEARSAGLSPGASRSR